MKTIPFRAKFVRALTRDGKWFKKGSALFKLEPPSDYVDNNGVLQDLNYVAVAFTPAAVDHEKPEATLYPSTLGFDIREATNPDQRYVNSEGKLSGPYEDKELSERYRVVGVMPESMRWRECLRKLGYVASFD